LFGFRNDLIVIQVAYLFLGHPVYYFGMTDMFLRCDLFCIPGNKIRPEIDGYAIGQCKNTRQRNRAVYGLTARTVRICTYQCRCHQTKTSNHTHFGSSVIAGPAHAIAI